MLRSKQRPKMFLVERGFHFAVLWYSDPLHYIRMTKIYMKFNLNMTINACTIATKIKQLSLLERIYFPFCLFVFLIFLSFIFINIIVSVKIKLFFFLERDSRLQNFKCSSWSRYWYLLPWYKGIYSSKFERPF